MSPPEDAPLAKRIHRELDWWFAPPWRALLTWLALAGIGGAVFDAVLYGRLKEVIEWPINLFDRLSPTPLPSAVRIFALEVNLSVLVLGVEPFALRLNLPRGTAWLALRIASFFAWIFLGIDIDEWEFFGSQLLCAVPAILVLRGWRSRPWMCIVGLALSILASESMQKVRQFPDGWLTALVLEVPLAVTLLYGTRLLRPDERSMPESRAGGS